MSLGGQEGIPEGGAQRTRVHLLASPTLSLLIFASFLLRAPAERGGSQVPLGNQAPRYGLAGDQAPTWAPSPRLPDVLRKPSQLGLSCSLNLMHCVLGRCGPGWGRWVPRRKGECGCFWMGDKPRREGGIVTRWKEQPLKLGAVSLSSSSATCLLCDFGEVTQPLWALFSPSVKWE